MTKSEYRVQVTFWKGGVGGTINLCPLGPTGLQLPGPDSFTLQEAVDVAADWRNFWNDRYPIDIVKETDRPLPPTARGNTSTCCGAELAWEPGDDWRCTQCGRHF